jgi:hypothetical protein
MRYGVADPTPLLGLRIFAHILAHICISPAIPSPLNTLTIVTTQTSVSPLSFLQLFTILWWFNKPIGNGIKIEEENCSLSMEMKY